MMILIGVETDDVHSRILRASFTMNGLKSSIALQIFLICWKKTKTETDKL
ncbi:unnamed protein product [Brassica oleracea]